MIRYWGEAKNINKIRPLINVSSPSEFFGMYCKVVGILETVAKDDEVTREEILKTYLGID